MFSRLGLPEIIVTDNGPSFASGEFTDFVKLMVSNTSKQFHTTQLQMVWPKEPCRYLRQV